MPETHDANRSADTDLTLLAEQQAGEQGLNSLPTAGFVPAPPPLALSQLPAVGEASGRRGSRFVFLSC